MTDDKFWGVRTEAAIISRKKFHFEWTGEILKNSYEIQTDPRVKSEILKALGESKKSEDTDFIKMKIQNEKDDYIVAHGINSLGKSLPKEEIYDAVIPFAKRVSHRNIVQSAVIDALDSADNSVPDERIKKALLDLAFGIDTEGRLRAGALIALKTYAKDDDVKSLAIKNIDYNFIIVKRALISLIAGSGDKSFIPFLKSMNEKTTDESMSKLLSASVKILEGSN